MLRGSGGAFVEDGRRSALLLTGDGSYVQLPPAGPGRGRRRRRVGWLYPPDGRVGTRFSTSARTRPTGCSPSRQRGLSARRSSSTARSAAKRRPNRWSRTSGCTSRSCSIRPTVVLTAYIDGMRAGQATNVNVTPAQTPASGVSSRPIVCSSAARRMTARRRSTGGCVTSGSTASPCRRAGRHDPRNALARRQSTAAAARGPGNFDGRHSGESPFASRLAQRPRHHGGNGRGHVAATCRPPFRPCTRRSGARRSRDLAVIQRITAGGLKPGTYTVSGRVPGTRIRTEGHRHRKVAGRHDHAAGAGWSKRFPLSEVVLDRDTQGRDTPFIKNRDKFIRGLAATNPDNFLYNFRDAFGQPQPAGATAARGMGQPDDEAARPRERSLPVGHRAGVCEHRVRPGAAGHFLRQDELHGGHVVRPVAADRAGRRNRAGRPSRIRRPCPSVPAARATTRISGRARFAPTTGTGAWASSARIRPTSSSCSRRGATYGTQDSQIWAPYYTLHKILAGLLDAYEVGRQQEGARDREGHGRLGQRATEARCRPRRAQHVEPLHRRRIRRHERSDGAPVPPHGRPPVPRVRRSCSTTPTSSSATPTTTAAWPRTWTRSAASTPTSTSRRSRARSRRSATRGNCRTDYIATNFWDIVNNDYMYSIGGVAGARNPNNAECFTAQPNTLWENGFASRRAERDLRDVQPAEAGSAALHVRPDRQVHGSLRARALQPHPRLRGRAGRREHVPRAAQPRRAEAVRQRRT